MAEGSDGVEPELTDEEKDARLANGMRDLLIKRLDSGALTASEMKMAMDLLEKRGYRYLTPGARKTTEPRKLPSFNEEGKVIKFG